MNVLRSLKLLIPLMLLLAGCQQQTRTNLNYEMGERVELGPFTYTVVENSWRGDLGEGFQVRNAKNRLVSTPRNSSGCSHGS